MSVTRHPNTVGFGPQNPYARLNITTLRARLEVETDPAERVRLQARIEERRAHNRAGKRKKLAQMTPEAREAAYLARVARRQAAEAPQ